MPYLDLVITVVPLDKTTFGAHDNVVVTIDFGSCCAYGVSVDGTTPMYTLDCPVTGSLEFDLTCLASSLGHLVLFSLEQINTRDDLRKSLQSKKGLISDIAMLCLNGTDIETIWQEALELVKAQKFDAADLVKTDVIWPVG